MIKQFILFYFMYDSPSNPKFERNLLVFHILLYGDFIYFITDFKSFKFGSNALCDCFNSIEQFDENIWQVAVLSAPFE